MTKHERAQVVELLRCAADINNILSASVALNIGFENPRIRDLAYAAFEYVNNDVDPYWVNRDTYTHCCLEAAQRLEERSWP